MDETALGKCDNDCMAREQTRRATRKTTEWNLGQPLAFPPKLNHSEFDRLVREAVNEAWTVQAQATKAQEKLKRENYPGGVKLTTKELRDYFATQVSAQV